MLVSNAGSWAGLVTPKTRLSQLHWMWRGMYVGVREHTRDEWGVAAFPVSGADRTQGSTTDLHPSCKGMRVEGVSEVSVGTSETASNHFLLLSNDYRMR